MKTENSYHTLYIFLVTVFGLVFLGGGTIAASPRGPFVFEMFQGRV